MERVIIRNPFFMIAIGIIDKVKMIFLNLVRRKRWPARILVINRAMLERIPLHCQIGRAHV